MLAEMDSPDRPPISDSTSTSAVPVAPSMGPTLQRALIRHTLPLVDKRLLFICLVSVGVATLTSFVAYLLVNLISLVTNLAFYQRLSAESVGPAGNQLGPFVVLVPVVGGVIVGLMARYGSKAIRGHGIPEAMEQVLSNESVIPARLTFLKPISAAISIGTGGPFGAEGPIIASGGAMGSVVGQMLKTTPHERKTVLASGAAAGMTALFGSPVSAVLLAIELLVFEYRPRSFVPIALATAVAGTFRIFLFGAGPAFAMPDVPLPTFVGMGAYFTEGLAVGAFSVLVTKVVYGIEDAFEKLPVHWMWWPAIGGLAVGTVGFFYPRTLGVGYDNIDNLLSGTLPVLTVLVFCLMKFLSWSVSLGSGTSGGTLAPLFTIGGGIGLAMGELITPLLPPGSVNLSVAALVGMAAMFSGASRAMLASILFAFETTRQSGAILPLVAGGTAAYIVSCLRMKHSIMTEKIARRGVTVPAEYHADPLFQMSVRQVMAEKLVTFLGSDAVESVKRLLASEDAAFHHQGYPVLNAKGEPLGIVTRKDVFSKGANDKTLAQIVTRGPIEIAETATLNEARNLMVHENVGRLLVTGHGGGLAGIVTRGDLLRAHSLRLAADYRLESKLRVGALLSRKQKPRP